MAKPTAFNRTLQRRNIRKPVRQTLGSAVLIEDLENRCMLSATLPAVHHGGVVHPGFVRSHRAGVAQPLATTSPTGLSPSRVRHAYGIDQGIFGTITGDGRGQTIAIIDAYDAPTIQQDLTSFDQQFGLAAPPQFTVIGQNGGTTLPGTDPSGRGNSWAVETSLDVEWAHAVAPQAKILLVEANSPSDSNLFAAVDTARRYAGVSAVSMSWGGGEFSGQSTYDQYMTTPSGHSGVTFVASSGDSGAYSSNSSTVAVQYPASSPNVLSIGGTFLNADASGNYLSESGWGNGTSSGTSGGSGGGISRVVAQPAYQRGVVTQTSTSRAVPDVSFLADPASGVSVIDSWDSPTAPWMSVGGTSLAAPMWAGVIAIANQGRAQAGLATLDGPTGTLPKIYALPSRDFHDITSGNNGYAAGAGYDLVTGRGTPIVNLLVNDMVGTTTPPPAATPTIGSFSVSPSSVTAGATVTLSASNVVETGGTIAAVRFYRESNGVAGYQSGGDTLVGSGGNSGGTWTLATSTSGMAAGGYTYYAVATDAAGANSAASSATLTVTAPVATVANDNFASATRISGTAINVTGSNVGATREVGEPNHAGVTGGKSVWWAWTAPSAGRVSLNTRGSSFDTVLAVYTGGSVSSLSAVASNDDDPAGGTLTSAVSFVPVGGVTYYFAVDGYGGASGKVALNLSQVTPPVAPANDNFASAAALGAGPLPWAGSNVGATLEAGEPLHAGTSNGASVWLTWTAPTTRTVSLNTHGSSFDTVLAVYTGSTLGGLTAVAANDDDPNGGTLTSALSFNAVAGVTYRIAVAGYRGATGNITLNLA